jgi:hypothetical protein
MASVLPTLNNNNNNNNNNDNNDNNDGNDKNNNTRTSSEGKDAWEDLTTTEPVLVPSQPQHANGAPMTCMGSIRFSTVLLPTQDCAAGIEAVLTPDASLLTIRVSHNNRGACCHVADSTDTTPPPPPKRRRRHNADPEEGETCRSYHPAWIQIYLGEEPPYVPSTCAPVAMRRAQVCDDGAVFDGRATFYTNNGNPSVKVASVHDYYFHCDVEIPDISLTLDWIARHGQDQINLKSSSMTTTPALYSVRNRRDKGEGSPSPSTRIDDQDEAAPQTGDAFDALCHATVPSSNAQEQRFPRTTRGNASGSMFPTLDPRDILDAIATANVREEKELVVNHSTVSPDEDVDIPTVANGSHRKPRSCRRLIFPNAVLAPQDEVSLSLSENTPGIL